MKTPCCRNLFSASSRQGFSLVEAAIVLGVVGLVIGGIWTAASTVRQNMQINKAVAGSMQLVEAYRRLYGPFGITAIPDGDAVLSADVINPLPDGFSLQANGRLLDPWGNSMDYIRTYRYGTVLESATVGFTFYNVPRAICLQMVARFNQMPYVYTVGGGGVGPFNMPLPLAAADSVLCQNTTTFGIGFYLFR